MDADMRNVQKVARRISLALTLVLGLAAVGCNGEMVPLGSSGPAAGDDDDTTEPPPVTGGNAEATFDANVKPLLGTCSGCHGVTGALGFLGVAGPSGYYAAITASDVIDTAAPANSVILTHTHAQSGLPELDAAGKSAVQAWITEEATP
jgi:mono/diheme cytochrome c family protein